MIDLRECKPGDKLISKHGMVLTYMRALPEERYMNHEVRYPNTEPWFGATGTRTHSGLVFKNARSSEDHDIVKIVKTSYSDEEVEFIERAIGFYLYLANSKHFNYLKDSEISESILEKLKNNKL